MADETIASKESQLDELVCTVVNNGVEFRLSRLKETGQLFLVAYDAHTTHGVMMFAHPRVLKQFAQGILKETRRYN